MAKSLSKDDLDFIKFCISELNLTTSPIIKIGDNHARAQEVRALGYYSPPDNYIWVLRGKRVPADWYRTLAHELVHWRQRELNQVMDGSDGSELENEANSKAAMLLREWGRRNERIYIISETEMTNEELIEADRRMYSAYVAYTEELSDAGGTEKTVEELAALKEARIYFENLRDGIAVNQLSNGGQTVVNYVLIKVKSLTADQISELSNRGLTIKTQSN